MRGQWPATEARLLMKQLLARLEPRRREVLERYFPVGENSREIAEALGVFISRVQQFTHQSLAALQVAAGVEAAPLGERGTPIRPRGRNDPRRTGWPKGMKRSGCRGKAARPATT